MVQNVWVSHSLYPALCWWLSLLQWDSLGKQNKKKPLLEYNFWEEVEIQCLVNKTGSAESCLCAGWADRLWPGEVFRIWMKKALASPRCYRILKNKFHREQSLLWKTLPRLQYVSCSQGLGESYIADSKSHLHLFFSFYRQMSLPFSVCYFSKWLCKPITHSSEATQYLALL